MEEEYKKVRQGLDIFPNLKNYIEKGLLDSFFTTLERAQQHPLFWFLLKNGNAEKLSFNLIILEKKCEKFQTILNKIHERDPVQFDSNMTEVDVASFYYSRSSPTYIVEFEPAIPEKGTKVDLKITINKVKYFIEIFTIFPDQNIQRIDKIHDEIRKKINSLNDNPFVVCYSIYEGFSKEDIDFFIEQVRTIIRENTKKCAKPQDIVDERIIYKESQEIAQVTLIRGKTGKGCVGYMLSPFQKVEDAGRIKEKVLTKISQLPESGRNIVIVNLSKIHGDFYDVDDAFLGQQTVYVDKVTLKGVNGRHGNGIIHHSKGEHISMIIAYTQDDYSKRRFFINDATAKIKLDPEDWKQF